MNFIFVAIDAIVTVCAFLLAFYIRFQSGIFPNDAHLTFDRYIFTLFYGMPVFLLFQYVSGMYQPMRSKQFYSEMFGLFRSCGLLFIALLVLFYVTKEIDISRLFLAIFVLADFLLLTVFRLNLRIILKAIRAGGWNLKYVLVIGHSELSKRYLNAIKSQKYLGYSCVGVLDDDTDLELDSDVKLLGGLASLPDIIDEYSLDEVVIALPVNKYELLGDILLTCEKAGIKTLIIPDYLKYVSTKPLIDEVDGIPLINTRHIPLDNIGNKTIKRIFDILFSLFVLIILSPVTLIIAVLIKISSEGPVIFKQQRIGLDKKPFMMYKFRTMILQKEDDADTLWTMQNDDRCTKIGRFLRKSSMDELPQFYNVLKGNMSIVGPRPERQYFVGQFKEQIPKYMIKHHVHPGITGWAQVNGLRGDTSIEERVKFDIYYIENWTISFDIRIIFLTIFRGMFNKNAY